jgi:hypothetical protein
MIKIDDSTIYSAMYILNTHLPRKLIRDVFKDFDENGDEEKGMTIFSEKAVEIIDPQSNFFAPRYLNNDVYKFIEKHQIEITDILNFRINEARERGLMKTSDDSIIFELYKSFENVDFNLLHRFGFLDNLFQKAIISRSPNARDSHNEYDKAISLSNCLGYKIVIEEIACAWVNSKEKLYQLVENIEFDSIIENKEIERSQLDMCGFLYVLSNKSMPGLLKIGYTTRSIEERIRELNSTGVPKSFELEFFCEVNQSAKFERLIHKTLEQYGYGKEFFECSINQAVEAIKIAVSNGNYLVINSGGRASNLYLTDKEMVNIKAAARQHKLIEDWLKKKYFDRKFELDLIVERFINASKTIRIWLDRYIEEENKLMTTKSKSSTILKAIEFVTGKNEPDIVEKIWERLSEAEQYDLKNLQKAHSDISRLRIEDRKIIAHKCIDSKESYLVWIPYAKYHWEEFMISNTIQRLINKQSA